MEAAQVQAQIEFPGYALQVCHIPDRELGFHTGCSELSPGGLNGLGGKIDADDLPAMLGECNHVGAGAASEIYGAAGGLLCKEIQQLRRRNAAIPRGIEQVPEAKAEAA